MRSRRSLLSYVLGPAVLTGGLLALNRAYGRSAPEFIGNDVWLNSDGPLTLAGLRGKVVLVEFCTYTCINWRRTLPYVNRWHREYGPQGLQIIGVHTPEFTFERVRPNVESAIGELGVTFPIVQDNAFQVWRAFGNRAWPSFYLLDRDGQIRLVRDGEGHAQEMEGAIRGLLGLPRAGSRERRTEDADLSQIGTPEMYFGSLHPTPQDRAQSPREGEAAYSIGRLTGPALNQYQLDGIWARGEEPLVLRSPEGGFVCVSRPPSCISSPARRRLRPSASGSMVGHRGRSRSGFRRSILCSTAAVTASTCSNLSARPPVWRCSVQRSARFGDPR